MKAKWINDAFVTPGGTPCGETKVDEDGRLYYPAGTIVEDPRAHRLVQNGVAVPADAECTLACCMTTEEMKRAQVHQEMVLKGIQQQDYQRYLDGEILGYDEDGEDIPGPNYQEDDGDEGADDPDYIVEDV